MPSNAVVTNAESQDCFVNVFHALMFLGLTWINVE